MTEALGDHLDWDPRGKHQRRGAVSKVMQVDPPHAGFGRQLREELGHVLRRHVPAAFRREYQALVEVGVAELGALGVLAEPALHQRAQGAGVELNDAVLAVDRLRRPELELRADLHQLLPYDDHRGLEVDVRPAQPECLPAAHARRRDDLEQDPVAVAGGVVEELPELRWLPGLHLRAWRRREVDVGRGVEVEAASLDCFVQGA